MKTQIKEIFKKELNIDIGVIISCGHKELKRNSVYYVENSDKTQRYVIKVYGRANKQLREINTIKYFKPRRLEILLYGVMPEGEHYTIYNYIAGLVLDDVLTTLNEEDTSNIFLELGKEMGRLHACKTFDYFGDWTLNKQSPLSHYSEFIISDTERMIKNIENHSGDYLEILKKSIEIVRQEYPQIRKLNVGRLCHRDLDGRNIIVSQTRNHYNFEAVLDFEKCVVFNEYFDIIGLVRRYFIDMPWLIKPFMIGYTSYKTLNEDFFYEFKFNVFRLGIDLASWSYEVSNTFYLDSIDYLKKITLNEDLIVRLSDEIRLYR